MKGLGGGSLSCLHMFAGHATGANTQEAQVSHKASLRASEPPGFEKVRAVLNTVSGRLLAGGPHAGLGRAGGAGRGSVWVRSHEVSASKQAS